jgi:hypothetical protein
MSGLFVPLNVSYYLDEKLLGVGPLAELLYVRSLAFCKAQSTQGAFTTQQLRTFGAKITHLRVQERALVAQKLWEPTETGWFITAWFNHNPTNDEIHNARSTAGQMGNHRRWHLPPDGTASPDCKFCIANAIA